MQQTPCIIRAETQARGKTLTGETRTQQGVTCWELTDGTALGFDYKKRKYILAPRMQQQSVKEKVA